jgi:hypothetical protein
MKLGKYRHYKGKEYEVLGVATHSENLEALVVYKALYDIEGKGKDSLWVRPKVMFEEEVEVDGVVRKRFELID